MNEKRDMVQSALQQWEAVEAALVEPIKQRAATLEQSYRRVRQTARLGVRGLSLKPQLPPDLLGLLVLQPVV